MNYCIGGLCVEIPIIYEIIAILIAIFGIIYIAGLSRDDDEK